MSTVTESCTSYLACVVAWTAEIAHLPTVADFDWMKMGAVILLVARLLKDVPDAIGGVYGWYIKYRNKNDKSNG